uniref:RXYLT1 C-terminal domain-containing protein n=1 Tax=Acrobeloides nanus TaxID=290746 RepID=A0A914D451_9BILA
MFTLCPWGINPESLRLYEAMEAGSIPIFQRLNASTSPMTPMGADNPIPQFENWSDAIDFIDKMRQNFSELEKLQQRIISFYKLYKESIQLKVKLVIDQAFKESHGYYC